jgi:hypothetical protein
MSSHPVDEARVAKLRDRLAKMDEAMAILQGLREEPMVDEGTPLDKIIDLMQIIHEWTAQAIDNEINYIDEDGGVA